MNWQPTVNIAQPPFLGWGKPRIWQLKEEELEQKCIQMRNFSSWIPGDGWGVGCTHSLCCSSLSGLIVGSFHRFVEAQGTSFALNIPVWSLWPALSHGQQFHISLMAKERGITSFCSPQRCHLPALLPAPRFLTTAISSQHLKDNCGYKYLPHNPAQPSLFPDRNHNLCSFSKYGKMFQAFIILHLFLFYFMLLSLWAVTRTTSRIWGWVYILRSSFPLNSMTLELVALGRQECNNSTLIDTVKMILLCFSTYFFGINSHPHAHKYLMNSVGLHKGHCGGEKKPQHIPQDICPRALLGEMFFKLLWPLWPCSGQTSTGRISFWPGQECCRSVGAFCFYRIMESLRLEKASEKVELTQHHHAHPWKDLWEGSIHTLTQHHWWPFQGRNFP